MVGTAPVARRSVEEPVYLPGYVPLQAPDDLFFGLALRGAPGGIDAATLVPSQAHHCNYVEGAVSLAVASAIETVADGLARGGWYGRYSAEVGEGGLAPESLRVVAGGDQQRRCRFRAHTLDGEQFWGDLRDQPIELLFK